MMKCRRWWWIRRRDYKNQYHIEEFSIMMKDNFLQIENVCKFCAKSTMLDMQKKAMLCNTCFVSLLLLQPQRGELFVKFYLKIFSFSKAVSSERLKRFSSFEHQMKVYSVPTYLLRVSTFGDFGITLMSRIQDFVLSF